MRNHAVLVLLWLMALGMMSPQSIPVVTNGKISLYVF